MPHIQYIDKNIKEPKQEIIDQANVIIAEYQAQGLDLTLRQLFYKFVTRNLLPNTERAYKRLGNIIADGRLLGLIDWASIVDRTRGVEGGGHWSSPEEMIRTMATHYKIDKWQGQDYHPEIWIEKDALKGVIADVCERLDVRYLSCRGYTSISEMWQSAQRLLEAQEEEGKIPIIFHMGDHDPSGMDMSNDIKKRLRMFGVDQLQFERIALNLNQIQQYGPPPNPTKLTDSRAGEYIDQFGYDCWELDALDPPVMIQLIEDSVTNVRDDAQWDVMCAQQQDELDQLQGVSDDWAKIIQNLP